MNGAEGWSLSGRCLSYGGPLASVQAWEKPTFLLVPIKSTLTYLYQVGVPVGEG